MNILNELTVHQFVTRLLMMLVVTAFYGAWISVLSKWLDDKRPQREGHLSLNPAANISYGGLAMAVLFSHGWIRPTRLSVAGKASQMLRIVLIILIGSVVALITIPLLDILRPYIHQALSRTSGYYVLYSVQVIQEQMLGLVLLSLIPLPGFLAGNLWRIILPKSDTKLIKFEPLCLSLMIIILILGWLPDTSHLLKMLRLI
ncbi:hypothetical protein [Paenochrobactrum glaciei]|uniref:Site-2 protease family protein n=1 Tax=Paenochrobactrum glaciei TaxID=486407 RepID=A0ABN1GE13_9HYPH